MARRDRVIAKVAIQEHVALAELGDLVVALTAQEGVGARGRGGARGDLVVAQVAVDIVVAGAGDDGVVVLTPQEGVIARTRGDRVVALVALDEVVAGSRRREGADGEREVEGVVAVAAESLNRGGQALQGTRQGVCAEAAHIEVGVVRESVVGRVVDARAEALGHAIERHVDVGLNRTNGGNIGDRHRLGGGARGGEHQFVRSEERRRLRGGDRLKEITSHASFSPVCVTWTLKRLATVSTKRSGPSGPCLHPQHGRGEG